MIDWNIGNRSERVRTETIRPHQRRQLAFRLRQHKLHGGSQVADLLHGLHKRFPADAELPRSVTDFLFFLKLDPVAVLRAAFAEVPPLVGKTAQQGGQVFPLDSCESPGRTTPRTERD